MWLLNTSLKVLPVVCKIFEKFRKDTRFLNSLQRLILIVFLVVILKNSESEL